MKKKVLVVGGAGYIGSHAVRALLRANYEPIVYDKFTTGNKECLPSNVNVVKGDLLDSENLKRVFNQFHFDSVMHFAAMSIVQESINNALTYYKNNVSAFINLLEHMVRFNVHNLIFSSTAAVYGEPEELPITENSPTCPKNPYGRSKLMIEQILQDVSKTQPLSYVILRYFNVAGADESGDIGEWHHPETHLIPRLMETVIDSKKRIVIFGDQHPTPDGTCIRDYVHVEDLAEAHLLALGYLEEGGRSDLFNLGSERGHTIKQVIQEVESVTQKKIAFEIGKPRFGDPSRLVANSEKAARILGWSPKRTLTDMIRSAYDWHRHKQLEPTL